MRIPLQNRNDYNSFKSYCEDEANQDQRFFQALRNWAFEYYQDEYATGEKPEIHKIFAGFDEDACEDTFFWEDKEHGIFLDDEEY